MRAQDREQTIAKAPSCCAEEEEEEEEESKVEGGGRRPSCALQYGRPVGRRGRGRPDYHRLDFRARVSGVGLSVRTVFFFFFFLLRTRSQLYYNPLARSATSVYRQTCYV
jgi:hypothetical protein